MSKKKFIPLIYVSTIFLVPQSKSWLDHRRITGDPGLSAPIRLHRHRWLVDPLARGTWSYPSDQATSQVHTVFLYTWIFKAIYAIQGVPYNPYPITSSLNWSTRIKGDYTADTLDNDCILFWGYILRVTMSWVEWLWEMVIYRDATRIKQRYAGSACSDGALSLGWRASPAPGRRAHSSPLLVIHAWRQALRSSQGKQDFYCRKQIRTILRAVTEPKEWRRRDARFSEGESTIEDASEL